MLRLSNFFLLLFLFSLTVLSAACMTRGLRDDGHFYGKHSVYMVGKPGTPWEQVSLRASGDISWLNHNDGATLLTNSHCKGVADVPLEALTQHLLIGLTEQVVSYQKTISLAGREALQSKIQVKIDGVPRTLLILVLKKDACVYDVVLSTPEKNFDVNQQAFQRVIKALKVKTRL